MNWRAFTFPFFMGWVLWSLVKDLVRRELSLGEMRTNFLLAEANAFEQAALFDRAVRVYDQILKRQKKSIPVFLNLGGLYYRKAMYATALPYYEKVTRLNPKHYQGHYWLAMCYLKLGRHYAAINTLEEVIEFLPTFKDALNLLGECYERIGEGAKAEHYYLKAISTDPKGIIMRRAILHPQVQVRNREERLKH
jgi:tetratricopeptide (TPR) repeat protein